MINQRIDNLVVDKGQQALVHLHQRHARAERGEHAGVFAADHAAAHNRQRARQTTQLEQAIAGENVLAIERNVVRLHNGCAHGDHDMPSGDFVFALLADEAEMHRVIIDDGGDAGKKLDAVALQLMLADLDLVADNVIRPQQQIAHGDVLLDGVGGAVDDR